MRQIASWFTALAGLVGCMGHLLWLNFAETSRSSSAWYVAQAAVDRGDTAAVRSAIRSGIDLNSTPGEEDFSLLCSATDRGDDAMVTLLLDQGADIELGDVWHDSPLQAAAENNDVAMIRLLVKRGAKLNDSDGCSYALWRAATFGKLAATRELLSLGANPFTWANTSKRHEPLIDVVHSMGEKETEAALKEAMRSMARRERQRRQKSADGGYRANHRQKQNDQ